MASSTRIRRKPAPIWVEPEASKINQSLEAGSVDAVSSPLSDTFQPQSIPMLLECEGVQRPMYALSVYNGSKESIPTPSPPPVVTIRPVIPPRNPRRPMTAPSSSTPRPTPIAAAPAVQSPLPSPGGLKILRGFGRLVKKAAGLPDVYRHERTTSVPEIAAKAVIEEPLPTPPAKELTLDHELPILPSLIELPPLHLAADALYTGSWDDLIETIAPAPVASEPTSPSTPPRIHIRSALSTDTYTIEEEDTDLWDGNSQNISGYKPEAVTKNTELLQIETIQPVLRPLRPTSTSSFSSSLSFMSMTENETASTSSSQASPRSGSPTSPTMTSAVMFDSAMMFESDDHDDTLFESWFSSDNEKPLIKTPMSRGHSKTPSIGGVPIYRPLFNPFDFELG